MAPRLFSARLTKGGPLVGVKLFFGAPIVGGEALDRSHRLQVLVDLDPDGRFVWQCSASGAPVDVDGFTLRDCQPIDEAEYAYLTARGKWAAEHSPQHVAAMPRKAMDLRKMAGIF